MSKKILDLARDQQEEVARELGEDDWEDDESEGEPCVGLLLPVRVLMIDQRAREE